MTTVESVNSYIDEVWERDVMPTLLEYIGIPNVSQVFEADWEELGHMERAVTLLGDWARARPIDGMAVRDPPARRSFAGAVRRDPARQRRARRHHGVPLRAPRQAARGRRVARGPRPVDPGAGGRQALRAGRRRRRLRHLRRVHGDRGRAAGGLRPRPLRRADRGERGERQPRPARPTSRRWPTGSAPRA